MATSTATSSPEAPAGLGWPWFATGSVALLAFFGSVAVTAAQVAVSDDTLGVARSCGSAFDSVVDRSGWELWWAGDLDEPDDLVRSSLVRTTRCPAAINRRIAVAATLAGSSFIVAALARRRLRTDGRRPLAVRTFGGQVARLGRATAVLGAALSGSGVIAVIVLVADADSTLFLYTDRLVVGVVGLIVLMPTLALLVIGRVLVLVGAHLDGPDQEGVDA